jgi:hypothetical protein
VARALAGLALYPMTVRTWGDRTAGVIAVVLFHLAPLPFIVIGNANMTYAFGQSVAVLTLATLAACTCAPHASRSAVGLFVVASVAFLSHVGIFPVLLAAMLAAALCYRLCGGIELRPSATRIAIAGVLAAFFSVLVYYGHFPESYRTLQRVRGQAPVVASSDALSPDDGSGTTTTQAGPQPLSRLERLQRAARLGLNSIGWPIALLTLVGGVGVWVSGSRDRLTLLAAACGVIYVGFVGFSALSPIEPRFQRYSEEFIGRVNFAIMPIAVVLAARGVVWAWRVNLPSRIAAALVLGAACSVAARAWLVWIR